MSGVERIDGEQLATRLDYLRHAAGVSLDRAMRIQETLGGSHAKVVEELRLISKAARECALALEKEDEKT